jgi:hypothetical protein
MNKIKKQDKDISINKFEKAKKNLIKIQKTIKPFVKKRGEVDQYIKEEWGDSSMIYLRNSETC